MLKRAFDILIASLVLLVFGPLLLFMLLLVWMQDRHDPFYRAPRVARGGGDFTMLKVRSMVIDADRSGVNSTSAEDRRVTPLGRFIRRYKIDELAQFVNVLRGDMSVVGPRPNTRAWGVDLYSAEERRLLEVKPGITDLASIIFSDEGAILAGAAHPDLKYNRVIRPWKSRLGLLYRDHVSLWLDLQIIWLTALAIVRKRAALRGATRILERLGADPALIAVSRREAPIPEGIPPGAARVFTLDEPTHLPS